MSVTKHAETRIRERCGVNKKSCDRLAKLALERGVPHYRTKGRLNKWVTKVYFKNMSANNIRIYGDKAYIFNEETLITVIQIPQELTKNLKDMIIPETEVQTQKKMEENNSENNDNL